MIKKISLKIKPGKKNIGAEIIVNPQYTIKKHSALLFTNIEIEVTGYKGAAGTRAADYSGP